MGELALGKSFGAVEKGEEVEYSRLVEESQRFANLAGVLPFGKWSVWVLSFVPLDNVRKLWRARVEYLEFARQALEKRFLDDRNVLGGGEEGSKGKRQDIMQRFIEARDPETGYRMGFDELRAETSSLM